MIRCRVFWYSFYRERKVECKRKKVTQIFHPRRGRRLNLGPLRGRRPRSYHCANPSADSDTRATLRGGVREGDATRDATRSWNPSSFYFRPGSQNLLHTPWDTLTKMTTKISCRQWHVRDLHSAWFTYGGQDKHTDSAVCHQRYCGSLFLNFDDFSSASLDVTARIAPSGRQSSIQAWKHLVVERHEIIFRCFLSWFPVLFQCRVPLS